MPQNTVRSVRRFLAQILTFVLAFTGLQVMSSPASAVAVTTITPNWSAPTSPAQGFTSIAHDGSTYVAVSNNGTNRALTSSDGLNWTQSAAQAGGWAALTAGPTGTFVAIAASGGSSSNQVMRSTDSGATWTMGGYTGSNTLPGSGIAYGNGIYVAVGTQGTSDYYTSATGAPNSWTYRTFATASSRQIKFGGGNFMTLFANSIEVSSDGTNWTTRSLPSTGNWGTITYGNGGFMITESSGTKTAFTTDLGLTWTLGTLPANSNWSASTANSGLFMVTGVRLSTNRVAMSLDGVSWWETTGVTGKPVAALASYQGRFVGIGSGGVITSRPPIVTAAPTPNSSTVVGGVSVTLTGVNLDQVDAVKFSGTDGTITSKTSTQIVVTAPAKAAGAVNIVVTTPNDGSATITGGFTYYEVPVAGVILPKNGPVTGGTRVTILGSGLAGTTAVTFDGIAGTSLSASANTLTVTSPAHAAGVVDIAIVNPATTVLAASAFTYQPVAAGPLVTAISPVTGPVAGGGSMTITGTGFSSSPTVTIGGNTATVSSFTSTQIVVTIPAGVAGQRDVVVTVGGTSYTAIGGYLYTGSPSITSVSPNAGPQAGGQTVTITGTGYLAGTTSVLVDGVAGVITGTTANTVTFVTPAGATATSVNVTLSALGGNATLAGGYTYLPAPMATNVVPSSGSTLGGTQVTIYDSMTASLGGTTTVLVDGVAATIVSTSAVGVVPSSAVITTPARPATGQPVDIVVTSSAGTGTIAGAYTYVTVAAGAPVINSISPAIGPVQGNTTVTISGTNLSGVTSLQAHDPGAGFTPLTWTILSQSATQITARSSSMSYSNWNNFAGAPGPVDIIATNSNGSYNSTGGFNYVVGRPTISSITPSSGLVGGGTSVTIVGTNFDPFGRGLGFVDVTFGPNYATVTAVSDTQVVLSTPAGAGVGPVDVDLTAQSGAWPNNALVTNGFTYSNSVTPVPTIGSISPTTGSVAGGTSVTLTGTNLSNISSVTVGGQSVSFTVNSATSISFTTPAASAGTASVAVSNGTNTATLANAFTFQAGVPGAPTSVAATPGNAQAAVSWVAPASNGGSTITGYTVTASPGGATCSATPPATTCNVTGLTNGTSYTFSVVAANAQGNSSAAVSAATLLPAAPGTPTAPTVSAVGTTAAQVTIAAPSTGGAATSYLVTASPGGATCTVTAPATTCQVTGLTAGQTYTFSYTATNGVGTSAASPQSTPLTLSLQPGTPPAPVATVLSATSVSVSVAAAIAGGTPTSYTVTSNPGGLTCTVAAPATACTVAGLTTGQSYTFSAVATNANGSSSSSPASNSVTAFAQVANPNPTPVPVVTSVSVSTTSNSATITGTGLGNVLLVQVGGLSTKIVNATPVSVTVALRPLPPGKYDTLMYFKNGQALRVDSSVTIAGAPTATQPSQASLLIAGFAKGSSVIPSARLSAVVSRLKQLGIKTVECVGSTEGPNVLRADARLAFNRASVVCQALKAAGFKVKSTSYVNELKSGAKYRSVSVRFTR